MNNFFNKFSRAMKKGNAFTILIIVLILAIAFTSLYFGLFAKKTAGTGIPAIPAESAAESNRISIKDKYDGTITIPKFNIPLNTYDLKKFKSENGLVTYSGGDSYVGIDVSELQGTVDWAKVKESGVDFVFIRSAWRGMTRGKIYEDAEFKNNIKGASDNGIKVGIYFFSQATSVQEAEEEAAYTINQLTKYKIDYPVVFDWEMNEGSRVVSAKGEDVSTYAAAFCKKIELAGYKPMVYMNKSLGYDFYNLEVIGKYDFWIAEYEPEPSFYYNFEVWQYSDSGAVQGIEGNVDVNISFVDYSK
ncbi:MAG: glycoside hydrolase family 25 protein [Oscillospiraceae bacterium]